MALKVFGELGTCRQQLSRCVGSYSLFVGVVGDTTALVLVPGYVEDAACFSKVGC